jgi:hypothetical protein
MDEDRLSPPLGRLIDAAKAAAGEGAVDGPTEGVALLTDAGTVHAGCSRGHPDSSVPSAADVALDAARQAGSGEILAAAVAMPTDTADTVLPSTRSRQSLADIDADLPLVFKQQGRWVSLPLSQIPPRA